MANPAEAKLPAAAAMPATGGPIAQFDSKRFIRSPNSARRIEDGQKGAKSCSLQKNLTLTMFTIKTASRPESSHLRVMSLLWFGSAFLARGVTPWTYINMKIPSARAKTFKHVREFDGLWILLVLFFKMIKCKVHIALEWPRRCRYCK